MSVSTKILVVDDEQTIRDSLAKMLRAEGYEIVLAENGQEAIEKLVQESFSLLLLDLGLPVKDGWATLKWLNEVNPLFPVIVITGRWKQGALAEAAGVDVLMEKPLDVPRLLQNIRELVEEPAEARARRIRDRKRNFRHVPCDSIEFCEELRKRYTTPYRFNEPTEPKH
jgi:CheY-like chemotaxis protein